MCLSFQVSYSGSVTWVSRGGMLVQFLESGELQTDYTSLTVRPLTPETNYQFKVSALTEKGEGAEVVQYGRTSEASGGEARHTENLHSLVAWWLMCLCCIPY